MLRRDRTAGALCFSARLCLPCGDFLLHLLDQLGQLFLTLFLCFGIYIPSHALSIDNGRVSAFPEVFADLADTAGAGLAALALVGLEGGGRRVSWHRVNFLGGFAFDNSTVYLSGGGPLHLVGHMGIDVQRGTAGHMANDGRKSLDVHTVLQGSGGEGVAQIVEAESLAVGTFQHSGQPLSYCCGVHGGVLFDWRWEHPPGGWSGLVGFEHIQDWGGEEHSPLARFGFGRRYHQFPSRTVDLPFHLERSRFEIQVIPLEGADLTPAQTGG